MNKEALAVLLTVAVTAGSAARILGVFPAPSRSHKQLYSPLLEELASRGHEVTVMSPFEEKKGASNVTGVKVSANAFHLNGTVISLLTHPNVFVRSFYLFVTTTTSMDLVLASPEVRQLIQSSDQHFDLVIALTYTNDVLLAFGRRFNAPVITVCTTLGIPWVEAMVGSDLNPSYVPNTLLSFSDHMTFYERFVNFVFSSWCKLMYRFYVIPAQDAIVRKHFSNAELPPVHDLYSDVSVNFINIVPGINYPRPLTPNMVPVGGLHILPTRPLPQDMKKFLDDATEGAILFSLGSNLRSANLSKERLEIILKVFSKLKQKVMWKFELDSLEGLPDNVKIWKWLPQNDVLAHPNMKAFITHGGLLSSQEAIYHGVPVLVIPFLGDQQLNAEQAQRSGVGIMLELSALTEASFDKALVELLYNPRFRGKAARLSRIFGDQPQSALERAVFWTEYVLRHKGAAHLRPAAVDLAWYQYHLLDVIAALALAVATPLCCALYLLRRLFFTTKKIRVTRGKKND